MTKTIPGPSFVFLLSVQYKTLLFYNHNNTANQLRRLLIRSCSGCPATSSHHLHWFNVTEWSPLTRMERAGPAFVTRTPVHFLILPLWYTSTPNLFRGFVTIFEQVFSQTSEFANLMHTFVVTGIIRVRINVFSCGRTEQKIFLFSLPSFVVLIMLLLFIHWTRFQYNTLFSEQTSRAEHDRHRTRYSLRYINVFTDVCFLCSLTLQRRSADCFI